MNFINNIVARFKLRVTFFLYHYDGVLDYMLKVCLSAGIASIKSSKYFLNITFKNGLVLEAWNENKYYAWLQSGYIGNYNWDYMRPSAYTMLCLLQAMQDFTIKGLKSTDLELEGDS